MDNQHINFLHKEPYSEPPVRSRKRWIFLLFIFIMLAAIVIGGYAFANRDRFMDPLDYDPVTLEPKKPDGFFKKLSYLVFHKELKLEGHSDDRINILLLGMGGVGHDGPYLTDTIMIASIKPSTGQVALISIPRDLGVDIPGYGVRKVNHANSFGETEKENWGAAFATEVISKTFDIDIPYYLRLDFKAFEEIINEVGGIRVNVENAFTDYMYPAPNDEYQTISFGAGQQTMDGETALTFVRSRHGNNGEGSDFARSSRQQKIILALKEKLLSFGTLTNPVRIKKIMDSLERHMTTNMKFDEILSSVKVARELNTTDIVNLVLDNSINGYLVSTTGYSGAFLLVPKTGNFKEINEAIDGVFSGAVESSADTTPIQEKPSYDDAAVEIQNGTWRAGLAARVKQRLIDESFFVDEVSNVEPEQKPIEMSGIYKISSDVSDDIVHALQETLHIPTKKTPPQGMANHASSTDILIILGDDFTEE